MKMTRGLDAGPVYKRFKCPINSDDTAQDLSDRLAELAATHTAEVLIDIAGNELTPIEQDESSKSIVKKLHKADGQIDWTSPAAFIERQVRAYAPWPGAWFKLQAGKRLRTIRLTKAAVIHEDTSGYQPGMVVRADKQAWQIACGDNKQLEIIKCIPDGKQEMSGCDFLRGSAIETGNFLYETNHCELRESSNEDCSVH